jgi:hypothetical protein
MAQSGHADVRPPRQLSGVKRTWFGWAVKSAIGVRVLQIMFSAPADAKTESWCCRVVEYGAIFQPRRDD